MASLFKKIDVGEGRPRRAKAVFATFKRAEPGAFDPSRSLAPGQTHVPNRLRPASADRTPAILGSLGSLVANIRFVVFIRPFLISSVPGFIIHVIHVVKAPRRLPYAGSDQLLWDALLVQPPTPAPYHTRRRNQASAVKKYYSPQANNPHPSTLNNLLPHVCALSNPTHRRNYERKFVAEIGPILTPDFNRLNTVHRAPPFPCQIIGSLVNVLLCMDSSSMVPLSTQGGHSAHVTIRLLVNGLSLAVAQMGPDFLFLDAPVNHPPADASLIMRVDESEERWNALVSSYWSLSSSGFWKWSSAIFRSVTIGSVTRSSFRDVCSKIFTLTICRISFKLLPICSCFLTTATIR